MGPTDFCGRNTKFLLWLLLIFAASLAFYSHGFSKIPRWGWREESHSSQDNCSAAPRSTLQEPQQGTSEGDCPLDTSRVPEMPRRVDVLVMTPWLAPIVWEGTFDPAIMDMQFRNATIGLTIFAIKKYVVFLKLFLETAEQHFMAGHRVTYYVFTDRPADVPRVPLAPGRRLEVLEVPASKRWQDVSMRRMEMISHACEQRFGHEVDYLVCMDVDMRFGARVGTEILAPLFGTLHPGFYGAARGSFTYERRPQSRAYIPKDEGDFYYAGGFFGGSVAEVQRLTTACHQATMADKANGIEAVWHDESHLNRYLLYHKPAKVLSPEYLWDQQLLGTRPFLRKLRYLAVPKNHKEIRS